jgi:Fe-S cluster assembly ATP-binding protein
MDYFEVRDLHVAIEGKEILRGASLSVKQGEVHAIMGPNGSGKSTLAFVMLGHPKYAVTKGEVVLRGKNVLEMKPEERAKAGMFLSFQYPFEISGLKFSKFLFEAYKARFPQEKTNVIQFQKLLNEKISQLQMNEEFAKRELNVGFSGGEKKRSEILQMLVLKPELAILDETDSGLDIDSLKLVSSAVNHMRSPNFSAIVITHYNRILKHLQPDIVHVMVDGRIVESGSRELAEKIEEKGYAKLYNVAEAKS